MQDGRKLTYLLTSNHCLYQPVKIELKKKASERFKTDLTEIGKEATGGTSVDVFFFNLGVMADLPYVEKMYAACVVADFILRHMVPKSKQQKDQVELHQHPFSVILDRNHKELELNYHVRVQLKEEYGKLQQKLTKKVKLPTYDNFMRKVVSSRRIFSHVASQISGKTNKTAFVHKHTQSIMRLLSNFTKKDFKTSKDCHIVKEFMTKDVIELAIKGKFEQIENLRQDKAKLVNTKRKRDTISKSVTKTSKTSTKTDKSKSPLKKKGK